MLNKTGCLAFASLLSLVLLPGLLEAQQHAGTRRPAFAQRCQATVGDWCSKYMQQRLLPVRPAPQGNKECPTKCSSVGNCNYDLGLCECPAGWQGEDCSKPLKRPCTNRFRENGSEPVGFIDEEGRDLNLLAEGYTESRCAGICDDITSRCFCDGTYRRINAPKGSAPGTPAVKEGRPLANSLCQPSDNGKGAKIEWGNTPWDDLYGPQGWCMSDDPKTYCVCLYDGFSGALCDERTEMFCVNQCSGRGVCDMGFCKCNEGWYGTDCSRRRQGLALEPEPLELPAWLKHHVVLPEKRHDRRLQPNRKDSESAAVTGSLRRRPFIYVYDLPPAYNTRLLQYRVEKHACTWRAFADGNMSEVNTWFYGVEVLLHELMLQSSHRTFDPEEADFLYVPLYTSCLIYPIHAFADGPWWYAPLGPRVYHVPNMMLEARDWIRQHFPYWDRRQGRDHIFFMGHDEGACYAPTEIYNTSIFLTHWGRLDKDHVSNTAYLPDNYTQEFVHPMQPGGWQRLIKGHPCYTPGKDLIIPSYKNPHQFHNSPFLNGPRQRRTILLFFRGDMGVHRLPHYSRGIRQKIYKLSKEQNWKQYGFWIGTGADIEGDYSSLLARSKFCLHLPGDGWSMRAEDAILHGCVPVIIMDDVDPVFASILDWQRFSLRVAERDIDRLPEIIASVSDAEWLGMHRNVKKVWQRFAYFSHSFLEHLSRDIMSKNAEARIEQFSRPSNSSMFMSDNSASVSRTLDVERQQHDDRQQGMLQHIGRDATMVAPELKEPSAQRQAAGLSGGAEHPSVARWKAWSKRDLRRDDAFGTLIQWLYHKIPQTR